MGDAKFINVNINVDGKIHKVKIEEGAELHRDNSNEQNVISGGSIFNAKHKEVDYGQEWHWTKGKEIKMNASEFALFKNIADNCNEGDGIIFSKADFGEALSMYVNEKFTKDINKNLPKGDFAKPEMQYRAGFEYLEAASSKGKIGFSFINEGESNMYPFDSDLAKALNSGKYDTVISRWYWGDDPEVEHGYIDKDGWYCDLNGNKRSRESEDKNGNKIEEYYEWDDNKITRIYKPDGTEEYYKNDVLEKRTYTEDGKEIKEEYKDGKLVEKDIRWDNNAKIYDGDNNLIYEKTGDSCKKYSNGELTYERTGEYYKEYSNGKIIEELKNINGTDCLYKDGTLIKAGETNIKQFDTEYAKKHNEYYKGFENFDAKTIAKTLNNQISGFSDGEKTTEMINGIPIEKRMDVLKEYKEQTGNNLFQDLYSEWGLDEKNFTQFTKDFFEGYITNKSNHSAKDLNMIEYIYNTKEFNREEILNINEYILNN